MAAGTKHQTTIQPLALRLDRVALTNTGSHMRRLLPASLVRFRSQHNGAKAIVLAREREKIREAEVRKSRRSVSWLGVFDSCTLHLGHQCRATLAWPHHPHSSRSARVPDGAASPRRTSVLRLGTLSSSCVAPASVPLGLSSSSDAARDDVRNSAERDASDQHAALHAAPSSRLSGSSPSLLAAGKAQYHARSCPHELARPPAYQVQRSSLQLHRAASL
ncbi:hypothetical protein L1887_58712 [Cichorium endivia]|nr:hypothetical protein L1887_58712 [Cichorium endivia]